MVEYRVVKYCRACKARFVVERKEKRAIYCSECQKKMGK